MANETRKSFPHRFVRGDFDLYFKGKGLDIGAGADPLSVPYGTVKAFDRAQGDAQYLKKVKDEAYDFLYSSHCLEHLKDVPTALRHWARVVRPGGYLYIVVPDFTLYEKEQWPSRKNLDHKQSFSTRITQREAGRKTHWSIYSDIEPLLLTYGAELTFVQVEDQGYDHSLPPDVDQTHEGALCQICFIAQRMDTHA